MTRIYVAVNTKAIDGMAPVIYLQNEDGMDDAGVKPWSEVHATWQTRSGASASGDLAADRAACAAELQRLADAGHATQAC